MAHFSVRRMSSRDAGDEGLAHDEADQRQTHYPDTQVGVVGLWVARVCPVLNVGQEPVAHAGVGGEVVHDQSDGHDHQGEQRDSLHSCLLRKQAKFLRNASDFTPSWGFCQL